jgi:V-type ATPase 116kDa subunit family
MDVESDGGNTGGSDRNGTPQSFELGHRPRLGPESGGGLSCFCGVLNSDKVGNLERLLWRISRGNIFFRWVDIGEFDDPESVSVIFNRDVRNMRA